MPPTTYSSRVKSSTNNTKPLWVKFDNPILQSTRKPPQIEPERLLLPSLIPFFSKPSGIALNLSKSDHEISTRDCRSPDIACVK